MVKNNNVLLDILFTFYVVITVALNLVEQVKYFIKEVLHTYVVIVTKKSLHKSKVVF